jgi:hypothetical protein
MWSTGQMQHDVEVGEIELGWSRATKGREASRRPTRKVVSCYLLYLIHCTALLNDHILLPAASVDIGKTTY